MPLGEGRAVEIRVVEEANRAVAIEVLKEKVPDITIGVPGFFPATGYYVIVWGGGINAGRARGLLKNVPGITVK